jgi:hypothetical protein
MRTKTGLAQKISTEYEENMSFRCFVIHCRKITNKIGQIGNVHETPLTFEVPKGEKPDKQQRGQEKAHYTVIACSADDTKLPPLLIFKFKTVPKYEIQGGVIVYVHVKG